MSKKIRALLSDLALFQGIDEAEAEHLSRLVSLRECPARYTIMERGQRSGAIQILLSGSVKVFVPRHGESRTLIGLLGRGEVLGEISALDGLYHSASVSTMEPSELIYFEGKSFDKALREVPALSLNLARILARRLRRITDQFEAIAMLDVPGRTVCQLLAFAHDYGEPTADGGTLIPLRLTQTDLALLIGATREHVNRIIAFHRRHGQISVNEIFHFTLYDIQSLAEYHCLPWPI